jgi:MFS family permease
MKFQIKFFLSFLFLLVVSGSVYAHDADSLSVAGSADQLQNVNIPEDDFAPGLLFFAVFSIALIFITIGAGIVLTAAVLFLLSALIMTGIISSSVMAGIERRSVMAGFRRFILLITAIGGVIAGTIVVFVLNLIMHWWSPGMAILTGVLCGLAAGAGIGATSIFVLNKLTGYLRSKFTSLS